MAVKVAEKVKEKESRLELFKAIAGVWGRNAPKQASEFALKNLEGLNRELTLLDIMEQWCESDKPAATAWAESVDPMITAVSGPNKTMRENLLAATRSSDNGRQVISISEFPLD